jgi:hypothetical protein
MEKIADCARRRMEPEFALEAHLETCQPCMELWDSERNLTTHLRMIRIAASGRRSPAASREALMRQFTEKHQGAANTRWLWSLAAAAAFLLALILIQGHGPLRSIARRSQPAIAGQPAEQNLSAQADLQTEPEAEAQGDAQGDAQYEGFIPVPYVPPLATGELVSVVHTDLYPLELARLGVSVDPAWATELPADLLVGEDGFPRAVRVSDDYSDERGF